MPLFFVHADQIRGGDVTITGALLDHLRASLRVQVGEEILLGDGQRRRYVVRVETITRQALRGTVLQEQVRPDAPVHAVILGQALLKSERMDWAIQKATELGVARIVPLVSQQVIVRPRPGRIGAQQERWQRIALEAAQQSERWDVPAVAEPMDAAVFFSGPDRADLRLILSEREIGQSPGTIALPSAGTLALAVGPEGGWRKEELLHARACGYVPVTLGPRILRAETAALAALSIVQSRLGELG